MEDCSGVRCIALSSARHSCCTACRAVFPIISKQSYDQAGGDGSKDIQPILRILDGCLYSPALFTARSVRSDYNRLLCAVFALSMSAQTLNNGETSTDRETASQEDLVLHVSVYRCLLRALWQGLCPDGGLCTCLAGCDCLVFWRATGRVLVIYGIHHRTRQIGHRAHASSVAEVTCIVASGPGGENAPMTRWVLWLCCKSEVPFAHAHDPWAGRYPR